jgi:hypothetical protein
LPRAGGGRIWTAFWKDLSLPLPNRVRIIRLTAVQTDDIQIMGLNAGKAEYRSGLTDRDSISLSYECDGFQDYHASRRKPASADTVPLMVRWTEEDHAVNGEAGILSPSPFGFRFGMTAEQIIGLVGRNAVAETKGDVLVLTTAPRPHAAFDSYTLIISPETGLLWIEGHRNHAKTDRTGVETHDAFVEIRDAIGVRFGPPALVSSLMDRWEEGKSGLPRGMRAIVVVGSELLSYESDGLAAYLASKKPIASGPKSTEHQVRYSVTGSSTGNYVQRASLTYRNASGGTDQMTVALPWSMTFTVQPRQFVYLSAQNTDDFGSLECIIYLDDVPVKRAASNTAYGIATVSGTIPPAKTP